MGRRPRRYSLKEAVGVDFEDVLTAIGFGRWQMRVFLLPLFAMTIYPVHLLGATFQSAPVDFRCSLDVLQKSICKENEGNCSGMVALEETAMGQFNNEAFYYNVSTYNSKNLYKEKQRNTTYQEKQFSETYYNNQCFVPGALLHYDDSRILKNFKRTSLSSCPFVEYDSSVFKSTIVSQICAGLGISSSMDGNYGQNSNGNLMDIIGHLKFPCNSWLNGEWSRLRGRVLCGAAQPSLQYSLMFDLVCEQSYLKPMFAAVGTVGNIFGSILGGVIGDRFGRIVAVKLSIVTNILSVAVMVAVNNYWVVIVSRFLAGGSVASLIVVAWSAAFECTPSKHRAWIGMLLGLPFGISLSAQAGLAYYFRSWKKLLLAGTAPVLVPLVSSFFTPESPRWLLQRGRVEEAKDILRWAANINRTESTTELEIDKLTSTVPQHPGDNLSRLVKLKKALSTFWSPAMRVIFVFLGFIWVLHNLLFVGIGLNAHNFSDDIFTYGALTGAVDTLGILLFAPLTSFFGRRSLLAAGFAASGILFFAELAVPAEIIWLRWVVVMFGFFLVAGSLQVNYLYAPELFPTEIRARGFAYAQVLGNVGGSIAPFITDILSLVSWWGPTVAFGIAAITGSIAMLFLPETRNQPLPDTLLEAEELHREKKRRIDKEKGIANIAYIEEPN